MTIRQIITEAIIRIVVIITLIGDIATLPIRLAFIMLAGTTARDVRTGIEWVRETLEFLTEVYGYLLTGKYYKAVRTMKKWLNA